MSVTNSPADNTQVRADLARILAGIDRITDAISPAWSSRAGDTPAVLAALYRDAAQRIRTCGYDAAVGGGDFYKGHKGISIQVALRQAAETYGASTRPEGTFGAYGEADVADLTEELETRLAAVLHLTGQRAYRTGIRDLSDEVAAWERDLPLDLDRPGAHYRWHTQEEALAVLEAGAALLDVLGGAR
jgi:hypothetical protein